MATGNGTSTIDADLASVSLEESEIDRLVIGIDFGTTFSGVASAYSATPDDIDIIKTWPGSGITSDKVPTEIAYDLEQNGAASHEQDLTKAKHVRWGFHFKPEEPRLKCIKLFLDHNQRLPHWVSPGDVASQLRKSGKTVMDATIDYLREIFKHTMETLTRRYGKAFMDSTKCSFVLTCPAVWSDAAKNATLQAAEKAGMGNRHELKLISEPEAAAVYALKTIQPSGLKVGDNFVVCDAGGGTVDLISYGVTQIHPLRVEESAVGTGGLCGSAFLNFRFEDFVESRLGKERYQHMREKKPRTWQTGMKYFDEFVKRNFNEEEHQEVNVPFPGLPDDEEAGLEEGFLIMTGQQVKEIFRPVVDDVIGLVEGQVDAVKSKGGEVSGIILCGGFGQSDYLYTRLKQHFNAPPPPAYTERPTHEAALAPQQAIEILQPLHAWTAVVRGAVIRGIEGSSLVQTRQSRCHYGTSYATIWDPEQHDIEDRYWSPLWERWMVSDRMQWHIAKGTSISSDKDISFHYTRNFRAGQSLVVQDDLIAFDGDDAPAAFEKHEQLRKVCTLTTDLNAVPKGLFSKLQTTSGLTFDNIDFSLVMRIQSASLVFELQVDGVRYGVVTAEWAE